MDQKIISWLCYVTLIGWIIAFISYNGSTAKTTLAKFHLKQSLGIMLTGLMVYFLAVIFTSALGFLLSITWILNIGLFILWLSGLIAAVQSREKPVPVMGNFYQKTLS